MTMPSVDPNALGPGSFQLPAAADRRQRHGSLFTAALFAAGKDDCQCKACLYLKRLRDRMVDEAEDLLSATDG